MSNSQLWQRDGILPIETLLNATEVAEVRSVLDDLLAGKYATDHLRSDLSGVSNTKGQEKITQLMRPSLVLDNTSPLPIFAKTKKIAKEILGEDVAMDFDMIINKMPQTYAITPWHQDAAYWPSLTDTRAASFWISLDDVDKKNGCMMYIPRSHKKPLQKHEFAHTGGALCTQIAPEANIYYGELKAGSVIAHDGGTLHAALGNKSNDRQRRAWIINYRPQTMINYMRSIGYDHTGKRKNKNN